MNLKDRLENIKTTNIVTIKDDYFTEDFFNVEEIFADSKEFRQIIIETINAGKNIVFVSQPSIDNSLIAKYFKFLMAYKQEDVYLSNNVTEEFLLSDSKVNIIASPSAKDVVKILEYIMYGYKSFVFGMNFVGADNIINKLKTSILINNPNITENSIETLLCSSNLVVVYFDKNSDGLFYISKIDKIVSDSYVSDVITILDLHVEKAQQKKKKTSKKTIGNKPIKVEEIPVVEFSENEINQDVLSENVEPKKIEDNEKSLDDRIKKINKYKKLKEKFKSKKAKKSE